MKVLLLIIAFLIIQPIDAQEYTVNGNATKDNCHCYTLTPDANSQNGSVWNNKKINLNNSFTYTFDVFLGNNDVGADGIAFVLQPISTSIGSVGGGMGYFGISPAVGVTLDTYQNGNAGSNTPDCDPAEDHIAIQLNGVINHCANSTNITSTVPISASSNNVEDGLTHYLKIDWDATTKKLSVFFDGVLRVSATQDFVNTIFAGDPMVFWGFTGATGGARNLQKFCTSLTPKFTIKPTQNRCLNEPIQFFDSTISFAPIAKFKWNFGDNTAADSTNLNPIHTYIAPGDYTVTQTVVGADGCVEVNTQTVRVGSKPVANFTAIDSCINKSILFTDSSYATVGTIGSWYWNFGNGQTATTSTATTSYTTAGNQLVKLVVKSIEGCTSDTLTKPIYIFTRPNVNFTYNDSVCIGMPTNFVGTITPVGSDTARLSTWFIGPYDTLINQLKTSYTFATAGLHTVSFSASATGSNGCMGTVTKRIFVRSKPLAVIKSNFLCVSTANTIADSSYTLDGGPITSWWWHLGNGQVSTSKQPVVTYTTLGMQPIQLVVNANNCLSDTATKILEVVPRPIAKFGISGTSCNNAPLVFSDSSTTASGIINTWQWTNQNNPLGNTKNTIALLGSGIHTIQLAVATNQGCADSTTKTITIQDKPQITMNFSDACRNTLVSFAASSSAGVPNNNYNWNFGDGTKAVGPSQQQHAYKTNGRYTVSLYALNTNGCSSDTIKSPINIYGTNANAGNDTIAAANQPVQLNASGGLSYEWFGPGLSNALISNPIATISTTTQYVLKAFTPQGCISYDTLVLKIYKGPEIYMPTAFTPNGDGLNDVFKATPVGLKTFEYLKIYNRWGQQIFETKNYLTGWTGMQNNTIMDAGTYVVIAKGIDLAGKPIIKKTTVVLIK
jgi:gliding motility-associated-like protein